MRLFSPFAWSGFGERGQLSLELGTPSASGSTSWAEIELVEIESGCICVVSWQAVAVKLAASRGTIRVRSQIRQERGRLQVVIGFAPSHER
ncbi:MAG: hypothetical protein A2Z30_06035 [Chloroflexi bacterium RBG_16_64_43]|nr:MAG: hypothetical protein A2Z30_06035 [Chloroflexi bacterium RBG_16_64_43]